MIWNKVVIVLFCLVGVSFAHHTGEEHAIIDEDRYGDLLKDDFAKRVLNVFFHPGYNHGGYLFSESELEDKRWFGRQRTKLFPVLIEVLRRESTTQVEKDPVLWIRVVKKGEVLSLVNFFSEGDPEAFVEEVRLQLPEWVERQISRHDAHTGFIREALDLLARKGEERDIPLIESFLNNANTSSRESATKSLAKLKKRLASRNDRRVCEKAAGSRDDERNTDPSDPAQSDHLTWAYSNWLLILGGLLLVGILFPLLKTMRRN